MIQDERISIVSNQADDRKSGILGGIRVLDFSRFLSGPETTLFLAGMVAEVIKIDEPSAGDTSFAASPYFGASGVALDRRSEQVGVTSRLQIDYEVLRAVHPRLVYCYITGYGSTGPERDRNAFDLRAQAATGITGDPTGLPSKPGASLSNGIAETFALAGILGALYQRGRHHVTIDDVVAWDHLHVRKMQQPVLKRRAGTTAPRRNQRMEMEKLRHVQDPTRGRHRCPVARTPGLQAHIHAVG
jgi:crotonobetainyl-CoA:carnitine CoA-transferase CaiB-like acyl-CoA transferase